MKSNAKTLRNVSVSKIIKPKKYRTLAEAGVEEYQGNFAAPQTWFGAGDLVSSQIEDGEYSHPFLIVGAEEGSYKGETRIHLKLTDQLRNPEDNTVYIAALGWSESRAQYLTMFDEDDSPIAARFKAVDVGQASPFFAIVDASEGEADGEVGF